MPTSIPSLLHQRILGGLLAVLTVSLAPCSLHAADDAGAIIYHQQCASCHGAAGEGSSKGYSNPLAGDRSIGELAQYIDQTMPEGEPEKLDAAGSRLVAQYIYDAFYSPTAQARNKPARVELSRLTVRQYRQSIADIMESFRWSNRMKAPGLRGEYYTSRNSSKENRKIERVDEQIKFNFGEDGPDKEKIPPKEYFVRWLGGIHAPVTGDYEFIIRSENGVRLWVNDQWGKAILDAGVKSGNDTEYRASIFLIGGRVYPMRLELYKAEKEKTGSVELLWKRPHQQEEILAARDTTTENFPQTCLIKTPFPPDDRSVGYERGTSVSKAWEEATVDGGLEAATFVTAHLRELAQLKNEDSPEVRLDKLKTFCRKFAERAFRRPVPDEELKILVDDQFAEGVLPEAAVQRTVLLSLLSPRFLYREIEGANDSYNVASRLSFALWDSIPDQQLLEAARRNELQTPEQLRQQARRMVKNLRAEGKLREFFHQWLKLDQLHDLSKDTTLFAEFTTGVQSDLRTSLDLFLNEVMRSDEADFRRLVLADDLYLNGRLAKFYQADVPPEADFQKVAFEPESRAGVLSHPFLLAGFAYHGTSSPIHRGVWIARSLLGRTLRSPPIAVAPLAPDLHADMTTRERVALQTSPALCNSCHSMINPLGFGLENFDAVGRFRSEEKGKPIDGTGSYITRDGREIQFKGVRELAEFLAGDVETHAAFCEQLFQSMVKQPVLAYGSATRDDLTRFFAEKQWNIRELQAEIAVKAAFVPSENPAETAAK